MKWRLVALVVLVALGVGVESQAPPPGLLAAPPVGLLAAYAMENGTDASGNNRNATLTATTPTPGKYGNALQFNGTSSRMTAPSMGSLITTAFTIEAWTYFQASGTRAAAAPRPFLATMPLSASTSGWQAIAYESPDVLFLAEAKGFLTAGYTKVDGTPVQIVGPTAVQDNVWHHVAAVFNGSSLILYVDGLVFATTPATGAVRNSTLPMEIGGSGPDAGYLLGRIDDVRIYSRALTVAEVTTDMNTPVDAVKESVIGWDLEVWPKGADSQNPNLAPLATAAFDKPSALCNLAPGTPPPAPVINPTTARLNDPGATGRECELAASTLFNGVPLGTGYFTTAKAKGANGTISLRSTVSNVFDRVAVAQALPPPGSPVILKK